MCLEKWTIKTDVVVQSLAGQGLRKTVLPPFHSSPLFLSIPLGNKHQLHKAVFISEVADAMTGEFGHQVRVRAGEAKQSKARSSTNGARPEGWFQRLYLQLQKGRRNACLVLRRVGVAGRGWDKGLTLQRACLRSLTLLTAKLLRLRIPLLNDRSAAF